VSSPAEIFDEAAWIAAASWSAASAEPAGFRASVKAAFPAGEVSPGLSAGSAPPAAPGFGPPGPILSIVNAHLRCSTLIDYSILSGNATRNCRSAAGHPAIYRMLLMAFRVVSCLAFRTFERVV
jgi:hypothetical protein